MHISVRGFLFVVGLAVLMLLVWVSTLAFAAPDDPPASCADPGALVEITCPYIEDLQINGTATSFDGLKAALNKAAAEAHGEVVVDIAVGAAVPMSALFDIHAALRELKLWRVNYVVPEKDPVPLALPPMSTEDQLKGIDAGYIATLSVDPEGNVALGEEKIDRRDVTKVVRQRLEEKDGLIINIEAQPTAHCGDFLGVLAQVRDAGAQRIVIGDPKA